jgi:hypothetical protein
VRTQLSIAAIVVAVGLIGCNLDVPHSPQDYQKAVALHDPVGSLTTIVGPATAVVKTTSTLRFPDGDTQAGVRSVLVYDRPSDQPGMCSFQIGHKYTRFSSSIVKEDMVTQPCDGKRWARFRIAGTNFAFVAHLVDTHYKRTPVTLLEIGDREIPASIELII